MVYSAHVVHVLIASPSDVSRERQALRAAIWEFDDEHTPSNKVVLLPRLWEKNSTPRLGAAPQDILDEQIVDDSDVAIGIFWTRIGQLLEDGTPASVHELERFVQAGKPALLYFSNMPVVPDSLDAEQYKAVQAFKERAKSWGIYREYAEVEELVEHARRDLLATVRDRLNLSQVVDTQPKGRARPVARVERRQRHRIDSRGQAKIDSQVFLVLENKGADDARNVQLNWVTEDIQEGLHPPMSHGMNAPVSHLVVGAPVEFSLMTHSGVADRVNLRIQWEDGDGDGQAVQTLVF